MAATLGVGLTQGSIIHSMLVAGNTFTLHLAMECHLMVALKAGELRGRFAFKMLSNKVLPARAIYLNVGKFLSVSWNTSIVIKITSRIR